MPITLDNSNIEIQYSTGSNYIIEIVKSDLYVRGTTSGNLSSEPTVSPSIRTDIVIETFTYTTGTTQTSYTKTFSQNTICDILIVGGGGGGGNGDSTSWEPGGGGAGGIVYMINKTLNAGTYIINVGKGGASNTNGNNSTITYSDGNNITFDNIQLIGKGGGKGATSTSQTGSAGGSGGGGGHNVTNGGLATQGNTFWNGMSYVAGGFNGGKATAGSRGGGGGGAGEVGSTNGDGFGGDGRSVDISGVNTFYAGGGNAFPNTSTTRSDGGGGTLNGTGSYQNGGNALPNTGSGGAGAYSPGYSGGAGGSGIVIIRYRSLAAAPASVNMFKTLNFNYYPTLSPTIFTLNFPTKTIANINNGCDKLFEGYYTITLGNTLSTIVPAQGQNFQDTDYYSTTISIRYHTLNPVLDPIGAQWTYSSSNTNVYHMGSVGIGTTNPSYTLDVRGSIFSSTGGFTQSGLTTWSIASDRRIKENIVKASYEKCLENVKNIELYNFNFKDNYVITNDRHQLGFIAQEVQQVYPKAVEVGRTMKNNGGIEDILTLNITQIEYTLYGAVKELIDNIDVIENEVEEIDTIFNITTQ